MVWKGWNFVALKSVEIARSGFRRLKGGRRLLVASMLLVLGALASLPLRAQAIIAPGGRTLFNRESLICSFIETQHMSVRTPDGKFTDVTQYITPLAFVDAFAPKWQGIVVQPYVTADITQGMGSQKMTQNMNGLADSQFILQYDGLYSRNAPGGLTRLSGLFSVQAPTGAERFSQALLRTPEAWSMRRIRGSDMRSRRTSNIRLPARERNGIVAREHGPVRRGPSLFHDPARGDAAQRELVPTNVRPGLSEWRICHC